ncbi:MAG: hypothetical protein WA510_12010 [Acidobacteriaceae bacterium]
MRNLIILASLLAGAFAGNAQTTLAGKWHGTRNNLPVMDLTIEQDAGHASGSAIFYLIKSNSDGSNAHVDGQGSGPMENLKYEPQKVSFDMHRPDGSLVSFRVELSDADHARLFMTSEPGPGGAGFPLVRVAGTAENQK